MYIGSRWFLLLYVFNGFFKWTLKPFLFLLISKSFVLERFFLFEYHIFGYIIMSGYCQNHVNNIILFGFNCRHLFPEHGLRYVFMRAIINFMFNGITDEAMVNGETRFICFTLTSFLTRFISCTTKLGQNSIHCYLLFIIKFLVQVV